MLTPVRKLNYGIRYTLFDGIFTPFFQTRAQKNGGKSRRFRSVPVSGGGRNFRPFDFDDGFGDFGGVAV